MEEFITDKESTVVESRGAQNIQATNRGGYLPYSERFSIQDEDAT